MYISRKSRGNQRVVFNELLAKVPGLYNEKGTIDVQVMSNVQSYEIFNLTAAKRVINLEKHFEAIQTVFKEQMRVEQFDEYGLPVEDMQRLIGRVINMNPEEPKLNEQNIGLINLNEENGGMLQKIKLQISDLQSYSFFDGEIIVVEGIYDSTNSKLNVIAIHKPTISTLPRSSMSLDVLQQFAV